MYSSNHQTFNFGNSNFSININGQNDMNFFDPNSLFNLINSSISNLGMNINFGNFNTNDMKKKEAYNGEIFELGHSLTERGYNKNIYNQE